MNDIIQFNTGKTDILLVKVDEGSTAWIGSSGKDYIHIGDILGDAYSLRLSPGNWEIVGRAWELTEEQWQTIVEVDDAISYWEDVRDIFYMNYNKKSIDDLSSFFCDPTKSGHSILNANGIYQVNPLGDQPEFVFNQYGKSPNEFQRFEKDQLDWQSYQDKMYNPLILKKK